MAATISDIQTELKPLWVIDQRLAYHSVAGSGRLLDGLTYDREGFIESKGERNLPFVKPVTFNKEEGVAPGARGSFGPGIKVGTRLSLIVSAHREFGLFQRDPTAVQDEPNFGGVGVLQWMTKVLDAIETKIDGTGLVDPYLEDILNSPLEISVDEAPVNDLSWSVIIQIGYDLQSICRGTRSDT